MYDLRDYEPEEKLYGEVKAGWHNGKTYRADLRNGRSRRGKDYQYVKVDFETEGVLVPAFFFHKRGQEKPEPLFGKLISIAGITGDYSNDQPGFFRTLIGIELRIRVVHRYKKAGNRRIRRDQVIDFEPLSGPIEPDEIEDIDARLDEKLDGASNGDLDGDPDNHSYWK